MKNGSEMLNDLSTIFDDLKAGTIEIKRAAELNNGAGKMIAIAKLQLEHSIARHEKPDVEFLRPPSGYLLGQRPKKGG